MSKPTMQPPTPTPHVFLLPANPSGSSLTIINLPHPRTLVQTRYLVHPSQGLHEITKLAAPTSSPRSWLLSPPPPPPPASPDSSPPSWLGNGQVIQEDSIYICTRTDPLFLLLPRLFPLRETPNSQMFLPMEDLLDEIVEAGEGDWEEAVKCQAVRERIAAVCETVDVGGDKAYRASAEKLVRVLAGKCCRMAVGGLPKSMEEEFVRKVLSRPMGDVMAEEEESKESKEAEQGKDAENKESKQGEDTDGTSSRADSQPARLRLADASEDVKRLLRIRVANQFLSATYLPNHIALILSTHLQSAHNFTPLDSYLAALTKLRHETVAMRSDDFSLKRSIEDEADAGDRKKKKKDDEEAEKKKKKNISRGVRDLKKVNTKGMQKMTSFFKKAVT